MNWLKDKIILLVFSLITFVFLFFIMLIFLIYKIKTEYYAFFLLSFIYCLIFSWVIIYNDLKKKKGIEFILGLIVMVFLELLAIAIFILLIVILNVKWPEKGSAIYSAIIIFPALLINYIIFTKIYKIILKLHKRMRCTPKKIDTKVVDR